MSFWGCNRRKEADRTVVTIDGYQEVPQSEEALLQAVTHQPVSVGRGREGKGASAGSDETARIGRDGMGSGAVGHSSVIDALVDAEPADPSLGCSRR